MSDMRETYIEMKSDKAGKLIGAIVVGLVMLAGGEHMYEAHWWRAPPKPIVALNQLPQPTPPIELGTSNAR